MKRALPWALLGVLGVLVCWATLDLQTGSLHVPHGNGKLPKVPFRSWMDTWFVVGALASLAFAKSIRAVGDPAALLTRGSQRAWMVGCSAVAFGLALAVHVFVARGLPLIEDESAYRYGAQLLAQGRLYADSLEPTRFFDNNFFVNDGKRYPQYFIGWPLILAPFLATGLGALANPVLLGLTVLPVMRRADALVGTTGGRLAGLLLATSPLAVLAAGTHLSHTATMCLLAWVADLTLRSRERAVPIGLHALIAVLFCWAFFIRPTTALGVGGPFLVVWLMHHRRDGRALASFVLPAAVLAMAFLAVNKAQTGSPTTVAYQAFKNYAVSNDYAFSTVQRNVTVTNFRFDLWRPLAIPLEGLVRMNLASFGWPMSLLFLPFAWFTPHVRPFVASFVGMFAIHSLLDATGMDLFGPVHVFEALLPLVVLSAVGIVWLEERGHAAVALMGGMMVAATLGYTPARVDNMLMTARTQSQVYGLTEGFENDVVFVPDRKFTRNCQSKQSRVRHNFRPENHPDLDDPVLWLNDLSADRDRAVLEQHFPTRRGWLLRWDRRTCTPRLEAL